jgi:RNA polymerase sigma-70 factor (ECF subfamily)
LDLISKQEEKELLLKLIDGDNASFEKIYFNYVDRVYYFALRYVNNSSDAEEIVQEVFTKIWESRSNINIDLSFSGYLLTATKNTIFNENRKKVNHNSYCEYVLNYLQKNARDVEREIIYQDLAEKVNQAIESLPPKRQEIFKLSRINGLHYKEISEKLGITEKTIETHMRLAFKDLKRIIEPMLNGIL